MIPEFKWRAEWTMKCGGFEQMTVLGLACDEKPYEAGPTERKLALETLLGFMREGYEAIAQKPEIPDSLTSESSDEDFVKANIIITREVQPCFGRKDA